MNTTFTNGPILDPSRNREVQNSLMVGDDPLKIIEVGEDRESETLGLVLQTVCEYVTSTRKLEGDPAVLLEKYFPEFRWLLMYPRNEERLVSLIIDADYVIPAVLGSEWKQGVYLATRKTGRERRKICFVPCFEAEPDMCAWPYNAFISWRIRILVNDPHHALDEQVAVQLMSPGQALDTIALMLIADNQDESEEGKTF